MPSSIKSIRSSVDYINVVWQAYSWHGCPANKNLYPLLKKLLEDGLIDELIEYVPDYSLSPSNNERTKRNLGLLYAKKAKVDFFMPMDADEFYIAEEVNFHKRKIIEYGITHSFCGILRYGFEPDQLCMAHRGCVQFFSKLRRHSTLKYNKRIITLVDPTRQLNHYCFAKYYFFPKISMHHFSSIRKNINEKYYNSSTELTNNAIERHKNSIIQNSIKFKDIFNLQNVIDNFK